jgi:hypothetical protein
VRLPAVPTASPLRRPATGRRLAAGGRRARRARFARLGQARLVQSDDAPAPTWVSSPAVRRLRNPRAMNPRGTRRVQPRQRPRRPRRRARRCLGRDAECGRIVPTRGTLALGAICHEKSPVRKNKEREAAAALAAASLIVSRDCQIVRKTTRSLARERHRPCGPVPTRSSG